MISSQHSATKRHRRRKLLRRRWKWVALIFLVGVAVMGYVVFSVRTRAPRAGPAATSAVDPSKRELVTWTARALAVAERFHAVYTPCWEGAYGAIGDAYLFATTHDSTLLRFHLVEMDLIKMCEGTWVDDRAWVCLAELKWWELTGRVNMRLVHDATQRYQQARDEGRLSHPEGFWTWYTWPPADGVNRHEKVFTNSNMDQMATVACELFLATGERRFLNDALLVWNGDGKIPGVEREWYRGEGVWRGREGLAAFGKQVPWEGAGFCSIAAALYRSTGDRKYRQAAIATARRVITPANNWVDPKDYYQIRMDGNGAFVNFLMDAYAIAPKELADLPLKVEKMLDHVWTNGHGHARLTLHRFSDHAIRNGWNPEGGEDGYGVNELGTVHAQGEAARAFGVFAYYHEKSHIPNQQRPSQ